MSGVDRSVVNVSGIGELNIPLIVIAVGFGGESEFGDNILPSSESSFDSAVGLGVVRRDVNFVGFKGRAEFFDLLSGEVCGIVGD